MQHVNENPCLPTNYSTQNLEITEEQNQLSNALAGAKHVMHQQQAISSLILNPEKAYQKKKLKYHQ